MYECLDYREGSEDREEYSTIFPAVAISIYNYVAIGKHKYSNIVKNGVK